MTFLASSLTNHRAASRPRPVLAPVTTMVWPVYFLVGSGGADQELGIKRHCDRVRWVSIDAIQYFGNGVNGSRMVVQKESLNENLHIDTLIVFCILND